MNGPATNVADSDPYHYPPELLEQLIEAIPLLNRSKVAVLDFFRGAGVEERHLVDLREQVRRDRSSIGKHQISRAVLTRVNEQGDRGLRARREIVRRVAEFEEFSLLWKDDQLKARGLIAAVRETVNKRDAFTRMRDAEAKERETRTREKAAKAEDAERQRRERASVRDELCGLFAERDVWRRGKRLEVVMNRWCSIVGILIREAFTVRGRHHEGVVEQIDGVISLKNDLYLVEMKWHAERLGVEPVSLHMARVFSRGAAVRGLFISASGFTEPAISQCRDNLGRIVFALCDLEELIALSERDGDLSSFFEKKIEAAIVDRNPFLRILH